MITETNTRPDVCGLKCLICSMRSCEFAAARCCPYARKLSTEELIAELKRRGKVLYTRVCPDCERENDITELELLLKVK